METFDPMEIAIPFLVAALAAEIVLARARRVKAHYEARDTAASLAMAVGGLPIGLLTAGLVLSVTLWVERYALFDISSASVLAWVVLFFAEDFVQYWSHRLSHERRIWWASHVAHHSSQHFNLSTAMRNTWTGSFVGTWLPWLVLSFVGFPLEMIVIQSAANQIYQFFLHVEGVGKLPRPVEFLLNTPSHHRVHHARNPVYLDRNYGGILIVWDRMFGTFQEELDHIPARYGLTRNITSFNPLHIAFHEWVRVARDIVSAPKRAFSVLLSRPGWRTDGSGKTAIEIRKAWDATPEASPKSR